MTHRSETRWGGSPLVAVIAFGMVAMAFGLSLPGSPWNAVALLMVIPLGLAAPTATVVVILAVTVLVPWDFQDHLQILGGEGRRGVLFIDALLLLALARWGWQVLRRRIEFDRPLLLGTIVAATLVAGTFWGLARGADISETGNEARRVLFGAGTFLLAWPLLKEAGARRTLTWALVAIGLALGLWGLSQWFFDIGYSTAGDVGVRGGLTSGQLQGGLYAYPVAVPLAWSALVAGGRRTFAMTALLTAVLAINLVCAFLTFERTILASTALACGFVLVIAGPVVRKQAARWIAAGLPLLVIGVVLAEAQAKTAFERMALLGNVDSDNSFTHRMIEADVLKDEILARPLFGSGFGATVTWGVADKFAMSRSTFADLGCHWLAWKIGLPAAALVLVVLIRAVFRRSRGVDSAPWGIVRTGSRAGLLALLVTSILFGVFDALGITAVIGLLAAICYSAPIECGEEPHASRQADHNRKEREEMKFAAERMERAQ